MKLTGKCKEDFEKWLRDLKFNDDSYDNLDALTQLNWIDFPQSMQYGVYVDFFDSVGVFIDNSLNHTAGFNISLIKSNGDYIVFDTEITRTEARKKAIEKANELYNNK